MYVRVCVCPCLFIYASSFLYCILASLSLGYSKFAGLVDKTPPLSSRLGMFLLYFPVRLISVRLVRFVLVMHEFVVSLFNQRILFLCLTSLSLSLSHTHTHIHTHTHTHTHTGAVGVRERAFHGRKSCRRLRLSCHPPRHDSRPLRQTVP